MIKPPRDLQETYQTLGPPIRSQPLPAEDWHPLKPGFEVKDGKIRTTDEPLARATFSDNAEIWENRDRNIWPWTILGALMFFGGCATQQGCFEAHSASLTILRADGFTVLSRPAETLVFCQPYVKAASAP